MFFNLIKYLHIYIRIVNSYFSLSSVEIDNLVIISFKDDEEFK